MRLSYRDKPRLYTITAIVIAIVLNIAGRFSQSPDPFRTFNWRHYLVLSLLEREGYEPYGEKHKGDLLKTLKGKGADKERARAAFELAVTGTPKVATTLEEIMSDESQGRLVRMSSLFGRALLGGERVVDKLQSLYSATKDDVLKAYCLFAMRMCGDEGLSGLNTIKMQERKPGAEKFFDFDLDKELKKAVTEFHRRHQIHLALGKLQVKRYQYYSLPILVILGTVGALYPPFLLLLLPLIYFPYGATLGGWFFLLYISLSNVSRRPPIKMAFSLGIAVVVVACVDMLAAVFNFSLFALCILFNVDVHLRKKTGEASQESASVAPSVFAKDETVELVISMLQKSTEREKALNILAHPAPDFVEKLLLRENDTPDEEKAVVLEALGHCKGEAAYCRLKERLLDERPLVKAAAIQALSWQQNLELLSMFSAMAREKDYEVRISAINAIAEYGYEKAGPVLEQLLEDENDDERIIDNVRLIIRRLRMS